MKINKTIALLLGTNMVISPALSLAAPVIPGFSGQIVIPAPATNALPQVRGSSWTGVNNITQTPNKAELVINQNAPQAIINWNSFNIGATAAVRFNQRDTQGVAQKDWAALNRIYDKDPSVIFGKLSADGKVYLINQNGIMFGAGSQIDVHSLAASTLNLRDADFMNRAMRFTAENYQHPDYLPGVTANNVLLPLPNQDAVVANQGAMTTGSGGSVFLLGPYVENSGSITAPSGKIDLISSVQTAQDPTGNVADVQITEFAESGSHDVVYRTVPARGQAWNLETGIIQADQGRVGMLGNQVRQDGVIRSISAVKRGGEIFLTASDRVTTGTKSVTDVSISASDEKVDQSFSFNGGQVTVGGVLTTDSPQPLQNIEHNGAILAPFGRVKLQAIGRVFLECGSSIDVAGLWVDGQAADNQVEAQLNSVELKDSYGQKDGFLKGAKIKVDRLSGTSIGDISGSYLVDAKSARERATGGGVITIGAPELFMPGTEYRYTLNDIIVKQGALLDFSGGGFHYGQGNIETSRLLAGDRVYDIGTAPQWLAYDRLLGNQTINYQRHGISETFNGLYLGGGSALKDFTASRTVGSDAGRISFEARQVVLDGTLRADVTRGQYQTARTPHSDSDHRAYDISVGRGLEIPNGGTLLIGTKVESGGAGAAFQDFRTSEIIVAADPAAVSAGIGPDDILSDSRSILSAAALSSLNLGTLGLYANTGLTIEAGAGLKLMSGGTLDVRARVIKQQGEISIAGGTVNLLLQDNISSHPLLLDSQAQSFANGQYARLTEGFSMESGARISVAGERIDNSPAGSAETGQRNGLTSGGTIRIVDNTVGGTKGVATPMEGYDPGGHSLIVRSGAELDVSGGYTIDAKGKVSGADAGTLELRSATMSLAGDLHGLSLAGNKGGQLILHAGEVQVAAASLNIPDQVMPDVPLPANLEGKLVLGEHRLDNSGFSRIELTAVNNLSIAEGVSLVPSSKKLSPPDPGKQQGQTAELANAVIMAAAPPGSDLSADLVGSTSIKLTAGTNIYTDNDFNNGVSQSPFSANGEARLNLASDSRTVTAPGGKITLEAPIIRVEGIIESLSGDIRLKASGVSGDVSIASGASISARGYNKPTTSSIAGIPTGSAPQPGGTVTLESGKGRVILEQGSLVDVSGSAPVAMLVSNAAGLPVATEMAGSPGSLSITSAGGFLLEGQIKGKTGIQGQPGGTLAVRTNQAANAGLTVTDEDIRRYMVSGFDALTFGSATSLSFQSGMDMQIGRSLTLDAPLIKGSGDDVTLSSPWIRLTNSGNFLPSALPAESATGTLSLRGEWIDLEGSSSLAGFGTANLLANRDMRLSDSYYGQLNNGVNGWYGGLQTAGDLVLQGARIYPTTAAEFSLSSGGRVTILPSGIADIAPIYSAGGNLTISAASGINQSGYLAAPMGQISLKSDNGRVYLADGSITRTAGDAQVNYGSFDGTFWTVKDKPDGTKGPLVENAPKNAIAIAGNEVIVREGAVLDTSGGGSLTTHLFQPGIEGSYNPTSIDGRSSAGSSPRSGPNRFVILPDNSVQLPGFNYTDAAGKTRLAGAVHLEAARLADGTELKEGVYSLLPEEYAFVPGALIISDLGTAVATGMKLQTAEGYQMVAGYDTYAGTSATGSLKGFSIRPAVDVQKEGNFTTRQLSAGNSGDLTVKGNSTILSGTLERQAENGFKQGSLVLAGRDITIRDGAVNLPTPFDFSSPLPADLTGRLQVAASALASGAGGSLTIGDLAVTDSVTVTAGSTLAAPQITLAARNLITLEEGAKVNAIGTDEKGIATLVTPDGTVSIQSAAEVNATDAINLHAAGLDLQGALQGSKELNIRSGQIFIAADNSASAAPGLYLNESLVSSFSSINNVSLVGSAGLTFLRDTELAAAGNLMIDAPRITAGGTQPLAVTMNAPAIVLMNSSSPSNPAPTASGGNLTLNADAVTIASNYGKDSAQLLHGNLVIDGFKEVNVNSKSDLTLAGIGTLQTGGDLNITSARLTTSFFRDTNDLYRAPDFKLDAANGSVTISSSGGIAGSSNTPGGRLAITARSIADSGIIEVPSGQVNLTATGTGASDGIFLTGTAAIRAQGNRQLAADKSTYEYSPGGQITLRSDSGAVRLDSGALLDVSASDQGDAGAISLIAPSKGVDFAEATLMGKVASGTGGSFSIDTNRLDTAADSFISLDGLADKLDAGSFDNRLNIRARKGNLELDRTIAGQEVVIAADGGDITLTGNSKVNASNIAGDGGRVELYANGSLTMQTGASIAASGTGTGATGGEVWLGSGNNNDSSSKLLLADGSMIDVSGDQTGTGGSVYLRALRNGTGVNMELQGEVKGAAQIVAEANRIYTNTTGTITAADQTNIDKDTADDMSAANVTANRAALLAGLTMDAATQLHFRPGVEIRRSGDLALAAAWDLTSWRYDNGAGINNEPGVLTLRAGGNLTFGSDTKGFNLTDHPTPLATLNSKAGGTLQDSWGINLVAGADQGGANPLATVRGTGNLLLGPSSNGALNTDAGGNAKSGALVYTENAPLRFAAGNNADIGSGVAGNFMINSTIRYNLGTYGGTIRGETGGDLTIRAGAIQSAVGDIDLQVGGDLALLNKINAGASTLSLGTIRTTGEYTPGALVEISPGGSLRPSLITDYWTYNNGGNINLAVAGAVSGGVNRTTSAATNSGLGNAWDAPVGGSLTNDKFLTASYVGTDASEGVVTMAGGNIEVHSGGDFTSQTGAFGDGDLRIFSGGDLNGRFRLTSGDGMLRSMGNFGTAEADGGQVLELTDARLTVASQGNMHIGAVLNPDNTRDKVTLNNSWNLTYGYADPDVAGSRNAAAAFRSLAGSVAYDGLSGYDGYTLQATETRRRILPAEFSILAAGDINVKNSAALAPSPSGNLTLAAGGSINGTVSATRRAQLAMADVSPAAAYGRFNKTTGDRLLSSLFAGSSQANYLLHADDNFPVVITAAQDVSNLQLDLNKKATIAAGHDIRELYYRGENTGMHDISSIQAGNDIYYSYSLSNPASYDPGIAAPGLRQAGPGTLLVQAGNNIDLGNSAGIQAFGNSLNPILGTKGSTLIVVAGAKQTMTTADAVDFFYGTDHSANDRSGNGLRQAGVEFSNLKSQGDTAAALEKIEAARRDIIIPWFDEKAGDSTGSISMTSSQISSLTGPDEIFILARSNLNVGKSTFVSDSARQSTGIFTGSGGPINIYSGGDINVNESRVMSFLGGDLTFWSDQGNINAGRGAKTAVSASPPKTVLIKVGPPPEYQTVFSPPSVGSGIRALTYDPNATPGGVIPEPGNIYAFAPQGIIDAGEAGIAGGRITLGATQVLNVKNISFGAGSVGVPTASEGSVSLGALAGAGTLADSSKMMEQSSTMGSAKEKTTLAQANLADDFMSKFLDVRVISFDTDESLSEQEKKERDEKKDKKKEQK